MVSDHKWSGVILQENWQIRQNCQQTQNIPNVGTVLAQRLQRWANIVPILGERLVFIVSDQSVGRVATRTNWIDAISIRNQ